MFGVACILLQFLIATSLVYPLSAMHFCFRFFPKPSRDTYRPPSTTLACMFLLFQFSSSPTERLVSYYSLLDLEFRNSQYIDAFAFYDLGFIFATYSHAKLLPISNSARSYIHLFVSLAPIQIETNNVQTGLDFKFSQCSVLGSNSGSLQSQALIASINNAHTNPTFFNNINSVPTPNSAP